MSKNVKEIRESVLEYGFSAPNYSTQVTGWINEAVSKVYRHANLLEKNANQFIETVSTKSAYELESNYAKIVSVSIRRDGVDTNLTPIANVKEYDEVPNDRTEKGEPTQYFIFWETVENKRMIYFLPYPNGEYTVLVRYGKLPAELEDTDILPIQEDYIGMIEDYCLSKCYLREHDIEMSQKHEEKYKKELVKFTGDAQMDRKDGPEQVSGAWNF